MTLATDVYEEATLYEHLLSPDLYTFPDEERPYVSFETLEQQELLRSIAIRSVHSALSCIPADNESSVFDDPIPSTYEVHHIRLINGQSGFFKSYQYAAQHGIGNSSNQTALTLASNEVAGYQLSLALGYEGLVPETVIRYQGMNIGSFQEEVLGLTLHMHPSYERLNRNLLKILPMEKLRQLAIFDYLAGNQDRHANNVILKDDNPANPILIDNGDSFNEAIRFPLSMSIFNEALTASGLAYLQLTSNERALFANLLDDPTTGGMDAFLTEQAYFNFRDRLKKMLSAGLIQDVSQHNDTEWDWDWGY